MKGKEKEKGKEKVHDDTLVNNNAWQQPRKVITLKQRPLQSRNWSATAPLPGQLSQPLLNTKATMLWTDVLKRGLPLMEMDDQEDLHAHQSNNEHEDMAMM